MARIKIEFPASFLFATQLTVNIGQINYGGHLGNDAALTLVHEARCQFLQSLGHSESNVAGSGIILTDAALVYKAEVFWGDRLRVDLAIDDISKAGFDMLYRFTRQADEKTVLHAKTGVLFFDYTTRKPSTIPPAFLAQLNTLKPV